MHHSVTGEPISEMDMGGRFVPIADETCDYDDMNSQMSDTPLQLPASANVSSNSSALDVKKLSSR